MMKSKTLYEATYSTMEKGRSKMGTFFGVIVPILVTMLGSIAYLPFHQILSNGYSLFMASLLLGFIITFTTVLSLSATLSNQKIEGGGVYFLLSRSFGMEIGASIGYFLYMAQTVALCLCVMGAADYLSPMLSAITAKTLSYMLLSALFIIALFSRDGALKLETGILAVVVLGIASLFFFHSTHEAKVSSSEHFPFWTIFSLFYPALTGMESGMAFSGDLKNPKKSLIQGSLIAVLLGSSLYGLLGYALTRNASGLLFSNTLISCSPFPHFMRFAVIGASLASALGTFLSAPRLLHAMAREKVVFSWICRGSGLHNPRISIVLTFLCCYLILSLGSMHSLLSFLAMVFFALYGLINLATAIEDFIKAPSWRPTIKISWKISLVAVGLILFIMFKIDLERTILFVMCFFLLYTFFKKKNPKSHFNDLRQSILFSLARSVIYKLSFTPPSARFWRPNLIILSESASQKSPLVQFAKQLTQKRGFLTLASVMRGSVVTIPSVEKWTAVIRENLKKNHIDALVEVTLAEHIEEGLKHIISNYGMGCLSPNTVLMGECQNLTHFDGYLRLIKMAASAKKNVMIVRGEQSMVSKDHRGGAIDIWWDDRNKKDASFMILCSVLLRQNPQWRKKEVYVKSFAPNSVARDEKMEYLGLFFEKARLRMTPVVYDLSKEKGVSSLELISLYSAGASLVFLSMKETENQEEFKNAFHRLMEETKTLSRAIFVLANENIDLEEILL